MVEGTGSDMTSRLRYGSKMQQAGNAEMQMMERAEDTIIYRSLTRDRGQVCKYLHYGDDVAKAASM